MVGVSEALGGQSASTHTFLGVNHKHDDHID
jgi:hypothetical protein